MTPPTLELYGAKSCPFTSDLREALECEGRAFVEYDVEVDVDARKRLVALTGQRMIPALVDADRVISIGWRGRGCLV